MASQGLGRKDRYKAKKKTSVESAKLSLNSLILSFRMETISNLVFFGQSSKLQNDFCIVKFDIWIWYWYFCSWIKWYFIRLITAWVSITQFLWSHRVLVILQSWPKSCDHVNFFFPLRFAKLFDLLIEPTRIIVGQGLASGYRLVPPRLLLFHLEAQDWFYD